MTMRIGGMEPVPCFSTVARMLFFNSSSSMYDMWLETYGKCRSVRPWMVTCQNMIRFDEDVSIINLPCTGDNRIHTYIGMVLQC